jgi:hypothetical protein
MAAKLLPDLPYRRIVYKAVIALIPAVGALVPAGVLTAGTAGLIAGFLGFLGNLLADRGSAQLERDGTLILTGSVQEQVAKGTDILISDAVNTINGLDQVGQNLDKLNQVREQAITTIGGIPVLGPLAQQVLDRLK